MMGLVIRINVEGDGKNDNQCISFDKLSMTRADTSLLTYYFVLNFFVKRYLCKTKIVKQNHNITYNCSKTFHYITLVFLGNVPVLR